MNNIVSTLKRKRFVKYGIPFLCLIIGGSIGLKQFTTLKYQLSTVKRLTPEKAKEYGIEMKRPEEVTLESEYEKIKNLDIDNWENKRGPRPWEKNTN